MDIEVTAKKWGNSLGIILPKEFTNELELAEGMKFIISGRKPKKTVLEQAYGALHFNKSTEELLAEERKGFSKWI